MTQGVFVHGSRPKSKKEIKDILSEIYADLKPLSSNHQHDLYCIVIEATSLFGNEFDGSLAEANRLHQMGPFTIVGPDPYNSRKFYGTIQAKQDSNGRVIWSIK